MTWTSAESHLRPGIRRHGAGAGFSVAVVHLVQGPSCGLQPAEEVRDCPSSADRRRRTDCWSPNRCWSPEPGAPVGAFADAASFLLRRPGEDGEVFLAGRVFAPFVFCVLDAACSGLAVLYASSRDVGKRPRSLTAIPCCFAHVRTSPVVRVAIPTVCQA